LRVCVCLLRFWGDLSSWFSADWFWICGLSVRLQVFLFVLWCLVNCLLRLVLLWCFAGVWVCLFVWVVWLLLLGLICGCFWFNYIIVLCGHCCFVLNWCDFGFELCVFLVFYCVVAVFVGDLSSWFSADWFWICGLSVRLQVFLFVLWCLVNCLLRLVLLWCFAGVWVCLFVWVVWLLLLGLICGCFWFNYIIVLCGHCWPL